jgi:hypothetical protein
VTLGRRQFIVGMKASGEAASRRPATIRPLTECAIKEATPGKWFDLVAENRLRESIGSIHITGWNNSHSATEVAAKLRAVALGL